MSSCDEYLDLIGQKLDGCLSPDDALRLDAHLRQCPRCQAALDAYTWIDHGVASLTEEPPEDLHSRIMDAVAAEPKADTTPQPGDDTIRALPVKKRKLFFGPGTAMAAVAAVLVLLVGTGKIQLPGMVTTTTTTTGASADTAARTVETDTTVRQVYDAEFASGTVDEEEAATDAGESVEEDAAVEEAAMAAEPVEAAAVSESMAVEASDTSSLVLTESIVLDEETATVYAYHPMVGCTTELIFPENVDESQVYYSISDEAVAQVENGRIRSTGEGTAAIVICVDGWTETVVLDVATEEAADVAADFWSAGFGTTTEDDEDLTVVADSFLQADYLAMQSAVWMTDWEVELWHYEAVQVQSMGEDAFCFSADWRLQVAADSAWDSSPLLGEAYLRPTEDAEVGDTHYQYATVFYLLEKSGDGLWQLAWQGSAMPDVTGQVRTGAASEAEMVQARLDEDVAAGDVTLYLTEQGVNWLEQDGALYLTLPTEEAGAMLAQLETDFSMETTEIDLETAQPWVTVLITTVTDAAEAYASESEP